MNPTTWLVTGGAGYIGAHVLHAFRSAGHGVVVLDDLSTGMRDRVPPEVPFVRASVLETATVAAVIRAFNVEGVVHLAARKAVPESVSHPLDYYRHNVTGVQHLLEAMIDCGVDRIVFSSSAAAYGAAGDGPVDEESTGHPLSPYGETKLVGEWILRAVARAEGLRWVGLRYFNVVGAVRPELGDTGVDNLVPAVFRALAEGRTPRVFGDDYPTPDGSCVRDFVHVADLAEAHLVAAGSLERPPGGSVYNVGRGEGVSVLQVLQVIREVTGADFVPEVAPRRPGDPARVVAATERIRAELGWSARRDLREMVASAWEAWSARNPLAALATGPGDPS